MNYENLKLWLDGYTSCWLGNGAQKYKAYQNNGRNQGLFQAIEQDRFFDFYITNNKQIVYLHQLVAFYCCGGVAALNNGFVCPKGIYEIHHLDGNTFNNHPANLQYLNNDAHVIITKHQRAVGKRCKYLRKFKSEFDSSAVTCWSRKGKEITDTARWITALIVKTVVKSAVANDVTIHYSKLTRWFNSLLQYVQLGFDSTFVPTAILY